MLFCSISCQLAKVASGCCFGTSHEGIAVSQNSTAEYYPQHRKVQFETKHSSADSSSCCAQLRLPSADDLLHVRALVNYSSTYPKRMKGEIGAECQGVKPLIIANTDAAAVALQRFGLQTRTCVVTGGTKGIGAAIVFELASLKAKVVTCSRNAQELEQAVRLWQQQGLDVQGCVADVSTKEGRSDLMAKVKEVCGSKLDILVHNVGTNIRKPTVQYSDNDYSLVMSANLESTYKLSQAAYPLLKAAGSARMILISSVAGGPTALRSGTIYAMTKAAMNQLTKNLCCEWGPDGIRVNAVSPWYTLTPLAQQVLQDKEYEAKVLSRTPLKRVAQPDEVSGLVAFLSGPAGAYITGQNIAVDGGYSVMGMY